MWTKWLMCYTFWHIRTLHPTAVECILFSNSLLLQLSRVSHVRLCVMPHRWQPTRLCHPWDSPGKNTGVGCHFLLECKKVKSESEVAQSCPTQWPHGLKPTRLLRPWDFPGNSTGVGCHCLLRSNAHGIPKLAICWIIRASLVAQQERIHL